MTDVVLNGVVPVADHYAALKNGKVIGIVSRTNETQWGWHPLEDGGSELNYVPVRYAVAAAHKAIYDAST